MCLNFLTAEAAVALMVAAVAGGGGGGEEEEEEEEEVQICLPIDELAGTLTTSPFVCGFFCLLSARSSQKSLCFTITSHGKSSRPHKVLDLNSDSRRTCNFLSPPRYNRSNDKPHHISSQNIRFSQCIESVYS